MSESRPPSMVEVRQWAVEQASRWCGSTGASADDMEKMAARLADFAMFGEGRARETAATVGAEAGAVTAPASGGRPAPPEAGSGLT